MYESGKLSLGQASELAGLSKVAFAEILADFNISLINYPL
jgi:predicted HTH domain antitoxin